MCYESIFHAAVTTNSLYNTFYDRSNIWRLIQKINGENSHISYVSNYVTGYWRVPRRTLMWTL